MSATESVTKTQGLRSFVDNLPVVLWEADAVTRRLTFLSRHVEQLLGHPVRRWLDDPALWTSAILPGDRARVEAQRWNRAAEDDDYELSYRVRDAGGKILWLQEKAHVQRDESAVARRLQGVLVDITPHRAPAERERFLAALEKESRKLEDPDGLMELATRLLGRHLDVDRCAYARADEDHVVLSGDHATGLPPLPGRFPMRHLGPGALRALRAGEPWVVADHENDPRLGEEDLTAHAGTGVRAALCLPLLRGGRFVAAMAVHHATPRQWTQDEVDLVAVVTERCWESMRRARSDHDRREGELRLRRLVDHATDAVWLLDQELRFVEVNPAACALLGRRRDELVGTEVMDLVVDGEEPVDRTTAVWILRRTDGALVALELSTQATPDGTQAIGRDVTERLRAEAERESALRREREAAIALQHSLLPRELPVLDRLAVSARHLPASPHAPAGGDWYEVLPISGTVVGFSVGDVAHEGPAAAAVMAQLRSALAGYLVDGHSPAAALERLDAFATRVGGSTGSTCACVTFDWTTGKVRWSTAGHPPPLVTGSGGTRLLSGGGAALGAPRRAPYEEHTTVLSPGTSIVFHTDGLVGGPGAVPDRLLDLVREARGRDPEELADSIVGDLLAHGQDDDAVLVVARYLPPPLHLTTPAEPEQLSGLRAAVSEWTTVSGLSEDRSYDLLLAYGEAAANAVDHAYEQARGTFSTHLAHTGGSVQVTVEDNGSWRPPDAEPGHRGRGLRMIRALADDVELTTSGTGTTIRFRFATSPAATTPIASPAPAVRSELAEQESDGAHVLRITGDLDAGTVEDLRGRVMAHVDRRDDRRPVDIDLTAVGYLSSSGIALLLEASYLAQRTGRVFRVTCLSGSAPDRILTLSGLGDALAVHRTLG
ncbi:SpoIIE family protein phosphatase [Lentzea sp. NBRC 102530]|uniref:SpoIIE family protein phosphatase n=1 Tax=Lentzea sp. NBRC 102530 TaxID=3032201 RepID=UPI0024A04084|nr:SpoIIE family protein phosphatase [Lentzea sp. NBRC 102530]GLY49948.1 bifunctional protein kinase/phosphatase [Lentzea sp. NBRC 102530]